MNRHKIYITPFKTFIHTTDRYNIITGCKIRWNPLQNQNPNDPSVSFQQNRLISFCLLHRLVNHTTDKRLTRQTTNSVLGTIHQGHGVIDEISTVFDNKEYFAALFLGIPRVLDKVWYEGLWKLYKIKSSL